VNVNSNWGSPRESEHPYPLVTAVASEAAEEAIDLIE
jgi:hypothetical protein